jgi:hypothetical protein
VCGKNFHRWKRWYVTLPTTHEGDTIMPTQTTTDRRHAAALTLRAARRGSSLAARRLGDHLETSMAASLPDAVEAVQAAVTEHLSSLSARLDRAVRAERAARHRARRLRRDRDESQRSLRRHLLQVRGGLTALYGRAHATRVFGGAKTPRTAAAMVERARQVALGLRREGAPPPAPAGGLTLDRAEVARQLDDSAGRLDRVLTAVGEAEADAVRWRLERDEVAARLDRAREDVGRVLGGLTSLAGSTAFDRVVGQARREAGGRRGTAGQTAAPLEEPVAGAEREPTPAAEAVVLAREPVPAAGEAVAPGRASGDPPGDPGALVNPGGGWPPHPVHGPRCGGGTPLHRVWGRGLERLEAAALVR